MRSKYALGEPCKKSQGFQCQGLAGLCNYFFETLKTRDDETAEREELRRLISTLPIEKVRKILKELR